MRRLLEQVCFPQAPAGRLGLLRVLLGLYTLYYLGKRYRMLLRVAASDPALFQPVGVVRGMERPLPLPAFRALLHATLIANLAFLLGWRHRASGPLFGGLLLWLLCYRNSWSMIYHNDNTLVLHTLILGLAPAADAFSLDALRERGGVPADDLPAALRSLLRGDESWQYGWPLQLVNAVTLATYFLFCTRAVRWITTLDCGRCITVAPFHDEASRAVAGQRSGQRGRAAPVAHGPPYPSSFPLLSGIPRRAIVCCPH